MHIDFITGGSWRVSRKSRITFSSIKLINIFKLKYFELMAYGYGQIWMGSALLRLDILEAKAEGNFVFEYPLS